MVFVRNSPQMIRVSCCKLDRVVIAFLVQRLHQLGAYTESPEQTRVIYFLPVRNRPVKAAQMLDLSEEKLHDSKRQLRLSFEDVIRNVDEATARKDPDTIKLRYWVIRRYSRFEVGWWLQSYGPYAYAFLEHFAKSSKFTELIKVRVCLKMLAYAVNSIHQTNNDDTRSFLLAGCYLLKRWAGLLLEMAPGAVVPKAPNFNIVHQQPTCDQLEIFQVLFRMVQQHRSALEFTVVSGNTRTEHLIYIEVVDLRDRMV